MLGGKSRGSQFNIKISTAKPTWPANVEMLPEHSDVITEIPRLPKASRDAAAPKHLAIL